MALVDDLKFCSWAVARKNFVESLTHYQIKDGRIQSFNGSISLSSPIDLQIECQPLAAPFLKTIQACKDSIHMTVTPAGKLSIKSGNTRALIQCTESLFPEILPEGRELNLPDDFLETLGILEPLIGEDASRAWSRGILFSGFKAFVTNNVILAECDMNMPVEEPFNLPHAAVNELMRIKKNPDYMMLCDHSATFFYRESGRWLRTALLDTNWPDLDPIINRDHNKFFELEADFWEALEDLKIHVDEYRRVFVKQNFLTTSLDPELASYSRIEGLPDAAVRQEDGSLQGGIYDIEMLRMLKGIAHRIDFKCDPRQPALWEGECIRGAIIGRRL